MVRTVVLVITVIAVILVLLVLSLRRSVEQAIDLHDLYEDVLAREED